MTNEASVSYYITIFPEQFTIDGRCGSIEYEQLFIPVNDIQK